MSTRRSPTTRQPRSRQGETIVTFTATDFSGNSTSGHAKVTISPDPPPNTTPQDSTPPKNVSDVKTKQGNRNVTLLWANPPDEDFDHVSITRQPGTGTTSEAKLYEGANTSFKDTGLLIGTQYRYLLVTYDKAEIDRPGSQSSSSDASNFSSPPPTGRRSRSHRHCRWAKVGGATYYNVQLWKQPTRSSSASTATPGKKVYSAWPSTNKLKLKKSWKFGGKRYKLIPGPIDGTFSPEWGRGQRTRTAT